MIIGYDRRGKTTVNEKANQSTKNEIPQQCHIKDVIKCQLTVIFHNSNCLSVCFDLNGQSWLLLQCSRELIWHHIDIMFWVYSIIHSLIFSYLLWLQAKCSVYLIPPKWQILICFIVCGIVLVHLHLGIQDRYKILRG